VCHFGWKASRGKKEPRSTRSDQSTPFSITTIGIEIGKNTFHLLGLDQGGNIVLQSPVRAIDQKLAIQGELRKNLDARANQAEFPNRCNRKQPFGSSKRLYKRIATRYDGLARNYLASAALRPLLYGGFNESGP
jgi:hypothetical protein